MELTLDLWYLFPISIIIATIAMSTGIGGAVFFSPIFIFILKLEPSVAVGAALATEFFGFSSGIYAYLKKKLVDFKLGINLLIFSLPAAILGVMYSDALPPIVLKGVFAAGLIFIGTQLFSSLKKEEMVKSDQEVEKDFAQNHESSLKDSSGKEYRYTVCNKNMGRTFAFVGGVFVGMISVGLAELQDYHLMARCRVPSPVAVATSIFVVLFTVLIASLGHFYEFIFHSEPDVIIKALNIIIFTVPGVISGGQLGPFLQTRVNAEMVKRGVSLIFMLIGLFMLITII
jgi:uncharacterized membrane protein YfcA